jgi:CheY-like chemotaxis protein
MKSILILNDHAGVLALLDAILSDAGYRSITATNDQEALAILRSQTVDLLIQDMVRPTGGGAEFLQLLKSDDTLRHIPVLVISAYTRKKCALRLQERGLDIDRDLAGCFDGAFEAKQFLDAIKAVLSP